MGERYFKMTVKILECKFIIKLQPILWSGIEHDPWIDEKYFIFLPQRPANRLHRFCAGDFCQLPRHRESLLEFDRCLKNVALLIVGSNDETFYKDSFTDIEFDVLERNFIEKEVAKH